MRVNFGRFAGRPAAKELRGQEPNKHGRLLLLLFWALSPAAASFAVGRSVVSRSHRSVGNFNLLFFALCWPLLGTTLPPAFVFESSSQIKMEPPPTTSL